LHTKSSKYWETFILHRVVNGWKLSKVDVELIGLLFWSLYYLVLVIEILKV